MTMDVARTPLVTFMHKMLSVVLITRIAFVHCKRDNFCLGRKDSSQKPTIQQ